MWPVEIVLALLVLTLLAFRLSPRPGALLIRYVFNKNNAKLTQEMEKYDPGAGITVMKNQQYRPGDGDAELDIYIPATAQQDGKRLPIIVWTHGGAWLSGHNTDAAPYFKLLAQKGLPSSHPTTPWPRNTPIREPSIS